MPDLSNYSSLTRERRCERLDRIDLRPLWLRRHARIVTARHVRVEQFFGQLRCDDRDDSVAREWDVAVSLFINSTSLR